MNTALEWPNVEEVEKPIHYEIQSEYNGWYEPQKTVANQFLNVWNALFGPSGAKTYFSGNTKFKK